MSDHRGDGRKERTHLFHYAAPEKPPGASGTYSPIVDVVGV